MEVLIDFGIVHDHEKLCYKDRFVLKEGRICPAGIVCSCCSHVFSLAEFELHSGRKTNRPAAHIFLRLGRISLAACEAEAARLIADSKFSDKKSAFDADFSTSDEETEKSEAKSMKLSHRALKSVPKQNSASRKSRAKGKRSLSEAETSKSVQKIEQDEGKTGAFSGAENSEEFCAVCSERGDLICCVNCPSVFHFKCLDLDEAPEEEWFCPFCCCAVCKSPVSRSAPAWSCTQCQLKFHTSCSKSADRFCSLKCRSISHRLKALIGKRNIIRDNEDQTLSWSLLQNSKSKLPGSTKNFYIAELQDALNLLKDCFEPYIDQETKIEKISHAVYSGYSSTERMDYTGFYTVILEQKDMVASVATIRVHDEYCAEMPFICTHPRFRKKGMCRKLVGVIEELLSSLGVKILVLPAVAKAENIWSSGFHFQAISGEMKQELVARKVIMCPGSKMLHKQLNNCQVNSGTLPTSCVAACQAYTKERASFGIRRKLACA